MARVSRYFLPAGIRRLAKPVFTELKLFIRVWLNLLLPHRLEFRQSMIQEFVGLDLEERSHQTLYMEARKPLSSIRKESI